jgi:hypothetical protein
MRTLLFVLSLTLFNFSLSAQTTWNDYVIGRPMAGHYDAKKIIAKEWGINYEVTFAGCVLSDEISDKANSYQTSNEAYFEVLATKYGADWKENFDLDVKKEMHRNNDRKKGTWYDLKEKKKKESFYAAKKAVAKSWGISYEVLSIPKTMSTSEKQVLTERLLANDVYMDQLKNTFGQNWQAILNQEVEFELAKQALSNYDNVWINCIVGKPYLPYIDAQKAVANAWGINYEAQLKGCVFSEKLQKEVTKMEAKNGAYFKLIEKHYGKDWNARFNQAIQKELAKNQLKKG